MRIERATTNHAFFKDAEHYKAFRAAWKDYINSGKAKKQEKTTWDGCKYRESDLKSHHHLLHGLLSGKDVSKMYSPTKKYGKHVSEYLAYDQALQYIKNRVQWNPEYLLGPFGDTVTVDMVKMILDVIEDAKLGDVVSPPLGPNTLPLDKLDTETSTVLGKIRSLF